MGWPKDARHKRTRGGAGYPPHAAQRLGALMRKKGLLQGARVYLSGPMDFVASRAAERQFGWRNRVSQFLQEMGTTVFDPWFKPDVRGLHEYGREDAKSGERIRKRWTYEIGRASCREI